MKGTNAIVATVASPEPIAETNLGIAKKTPAKEEMIKSNSLFLAKFWKNASMKFTYRITNVLGDKLWIIHRINI